MRTQRPDWQQKIAGERIEILFNLAKKNLSKNPDRSRRYVQLARKIGMRYNVRFSRQTKDSFCKKCSTLLVLGKTMEKETHETGKSVIIKCKMCNSQYRKIA